jgi:hypothetical protein
VRFLLVPLLLLVACAPKPASTFVPDVDASTPDSGNVIADAGPSCDCAQWGNPRNGGLVADPLVELSGLVASRAQPGVLYAHNDSGDTARFFAIAQTGAVAQTFVLDGGTAHDWEDIALGPCPTGTCVYLGDIGDNNRVRTDYAIYRVPEPTVTSGSLEVPWERFAYEYPQGARHNAETIFMHPATGRLYLVTKEDTAPSEVYRFPLPFDSGKTATLELVTTLTVPTNADRPLTAGDVNPCGTGVLLRMYNRLVEYRLPPGETNFEKIFDGEPVTVPVANEGQGEAVAYGADGQSYFTSSEKLVDPPPLYEYRCR